MTSGTRQKLVRGADVCYRIHRHGRVLLSKVASVSLGEGGSSPFFLVRPSYHAWPSPLKPLDPLRALD
jgi:hypothetical protein